MTINVKGGQVPWKKHKVVFFPLCQGGRDYLSMVTSKDFTEADFFKIILFIYDLAALGFSCGTWDLVP